ncbi:hypothetical protein F6P93_22500 (plasmid) [Escherichia coli]|nr:hypothetical protein F6P93_22500 [Escherichia coli]
MAGSWSGTVGFNPLNRQTMEESWACPMEFNPLNRQAMEEAGRVRNILIIPPEGHGRLVA